MFVVVSNINMSASQCGRESNIKMGASQITLIVRVVDIGEGGGIHRHHHEKTREKVMYEPVKC